MSLLEKTKFKQVLGTIILFFMVSILTGSIHAQDIDDIGLIRSPLALEYDTYGETGTMRMNLYEIYLPDVQQGDHLYVWIERYQNGEIFLESFSEYELQQRDYQGYIAVTTSSSAVANEKVFDLFLIGVQPPECRSIQQFLL